MGLDLWVCLNIVLIASWESCAAADPRVESDDDGADLAQAVTDAQPRGSIITLSHVTATG
jgi:hypothetical protein